MSADLLRAVRKAMEHVESAKAELRIARDKAPALAKHRMDRVLRELDAPTRSLRLCLEELGFGKDANAGH